jgi:hypothetical protein
MEIQPSPLRSAFFAARARTRAAVNTPLPRAELSAARMIRALNPQIRLLFELLSAKMWMTPPPFIRPRFRAES